MNKKAMEIIDLINNGYGLYQMMEAAKIKKDELISLMKSHHELNTKIKKRFAKVEWLSKIPFVGDNIQMGDADSPEMAALKEEAKKLGVNFNPNIGYEKLKARVEEAKSKQN